MSDNDRLGQWMAARLGPDVPRKANQNIATVVGNLRAWAHGITEMLLKPDPISDHSWMLLLPDRCATDAITWLAVKYSEIARTLLQATEHSELCYRQWQQSRDDNAADNAYRAGDSLANRILTCCDSLSNSGQYRAAEAAEKLPVGSAARIMLEHLGEQQSIQVDRFAFLVWGKEETSAQTMKSARQRANQEFKKAGIPATIRKHRSGDISIEWKDAP